MVEAHCAVLFPLSRYLPAIESLPYTGGPIQVVLTGTSIRAVAAVKDLVYTGTCHLDKLNLAEILETLAVLGIEVSSDNSFSFQTEFTDDERSACTHLQDLGDVEEAAEAHEESSAVQESVKEELGFADIDDPLHIKEETEHGEEAFEGITVGKAFHYVESSLSTDLQNWQNTGKINKDVQVKIHKLKMGEKLSLHMEENLRCSQCLKKFSNEAKLNRHIKNVHNKERPHQCNQCSKNYSEGYKLTRHIKIVHNKERPYQCNQCLRKFGQSDKLTMHIKIVHNKEKPHACSQPGCAQKFGLKINLKRHMMMVHGFEKPHQCSQCLKKFMSRTVLTVHIDIVHNKERQHACSQPGCAQKFGLELDLKRHLVKVHGFEKPHTCVEQNCDEKFLQLRDLKDHLRTAHGAAKLVCGFQNCAATFTFRSSLSYHKKKHHSDK